jgi:hypothetical protein
MAKVKDEEKALRESFEVYGKVLIASRQFEEELSEHICDILKSMREDISNSGIELGRGKKAWKWENPGEGEKYVGIGVPIRKFPDLEVDGKKILYLGVIFNVRIENENEAYPYVALSFSYGGDSQKKWQDHFKKAESKVNRKYMLKAYAGYLEMWPSDLNDYRRDNLDDIDNDLKDIVRSFIKVV